MRYSAELWAEARRLYEDKGHAVAVVAAMLKVSAAAVYQHAKREQWVRPLDFRGRLPVASGGRRGRQRMTARLFAAFERQVRELETRLGTAAGESCDDRDVRLLATLAQTLDRLVALDATLKAEADKTRSAEEPADSDAFRRDLARRLDAIRAQRRRDAAGATEPGRD